ncbi:DUF6083 domain-containing protein [Streptomyces sp. NPDC048659]|uniref:DUF6083 domain-containing protein n=1 Tax=Streptomyces sp. NPDC048659 TaxID=3155489 RepID=UPI0034421F6A
MGERDAARPRDWEFADRAQARADGADGPPPPAPPLCPHCGRRGERRATYYGAYVLLEPGPAVPAHLVEAGQRWYVDGGGYAWNGAFDEPGRGARCRIPHHLSCPALVLVDGWAGSGAEEPGRGHEGRAAGAHDGT